MSARVLPFIGSREPWASGAKTTLSFCSLAPNPSPWTLDGTNTWILRAPDSSEAIVIDPGPADETHLLSVLAHVEAAEAGISMIVLTHSHDDHSAGAERLAELSGAPIRSGLASGDVLAAGDVHLEVLRTPGHSSDSLCFVMPEDGSLLTGDTVLGRGTTVVAHPDGRLADYLSSLVQLRDLVETHGINRILPGHGPILTAPGDILSAYLEHRRARLDDVRDAVAGGASSAQEVVEIVYSSTPKELWPAAEMSVRAQMEYLSDR